MGLNATASFAFLDAARWAAKNQAADQVGIARISAAETRRQVAVTAAEAYLAVSPPSGSGRSRSATWRRRGPSRSTPAPVWRPGKGSRLNHVRSTQELAAAEGRLELAGLLLRRAQEALGVAIFADGPVDADGDPELEPAAPPSRRCVAAGAARRTPRRRADAAADRVVRDAWKDWFPVGAAAFTPQYVTPAGFFEPAKTWRALFQLQAADLRRHPAARPSASARPTARARGCGWTRSPCRRGPSCGWPRSR